MILNTESVIHQELHNDKRERYVSNRILRTKINEFDTGPFSFVKGGPRGKNRVSASINMKCTCMGCPVQYEGTINKKYAYYRSRHDSWRLEIHASGEQSPIDYAESGEHRDSVGFTGLMQAESIIMIAAMNYVHKKKNISGIVIPASTLENTLNAKKTEESK